MRNFIIILILLVLVVGGGFYLVYANLDSIVEAGLEKGGTEATQADVAIDDVSIDLKDGRGAITGLSVGNPVGFSGDKALMLKAINLDIDPERTTRHLVVVRELTIVDPVITYEVGSGLSNLQAIQKNVEAFTGGGHGTGNGGSEDGEGVKFIVEKLSISGGEVKLQTKAGRLASSDIPTIVKKNLGVSSGGITGAELGEVLITALSDSATREVTTGSLKGLLDKSLTDKLGDKGGNIKDGIKGIFGGD